MDEAFGFHRSDLLISIHINESEWEASVETNHEHICTLTFEFVPCSIARLGLALSRGQLLHQWSFPPPYPTSTTFGARWRVEYYCNILFFRSSRTGMVDVEWHKIIQSFYGRQGTPMKEEKGEPENKTNQVVLSPRLACLFLPHPIENT